MKYGKNTHMHMKFNFTHLVYRLLAVNDASIGWQCQQQEVEVVSLPIQPVHQERNQDMVILKTNGPLIIGNKKI